MLTSRLSFVLVGLAALVIAGRPGASFAVTNCKVHIGSKNGVIDVFASSVSGPVLWGDRPGAEATAFANAATCLVGTSASKCELGAAGTPQAITPPDLCTLWLKDAASECSVYIKGCVPGPRFTDQAKADALKQVFSAITFHHSIPTVVFSGVNVQIVSGAGTTDAAPNGAGNLIVGYNEGVAEQPGSHNVVVGKGNVFSSYGGVVAGLGNGSEAPYADVVGGQANAVSASFGTIVGGHSGFVDAGAFYGVVMGGQSNSAKTENSVLVGGAANVTDDYGQPGSDGILATVVGGLSNTAFGDRSVVVAGNDNTTIAAGSAVVAGHGNHTDQEDTPADNAAIVAGEDNRTRAPGAAVLGGNANGARGEFAVVVGGSGNFAVESLSAVYGGEGNAAEARASAILGGSGGHTGPGADHSVLSGGLGLTTSSVSEWHAPQSLGYPTGTEY